MGAVAVQFEQAVRLLVAEQADGVDGGVRFLRVALHLIKGVPAGVVFSVGNRQHHFAVAVAALQVVKGSHQGVIKGRASAGINFVKGRF